ncbi:cytosolic carboxypeptidase 2-like isoform X3 [Limulus polyphemus]|nr:cytosolic carboxypeptidase 2-like isoform X3 [Limulus polyphemus]
MVPQLTQPRGPAIIGIEPGVQNLPRWPAEMQVIEERIRHIPNSFNEREPYYVSTGLEPQPFVVGEAKGQVVYYYKPLTGSYFLQSKLGHPSSQDEIAVTPQNSDDVTLVFESRFESGNLEKAIQLSQFCYELYLRPDLYSERHSQWFYFCVSNTRSNITYRFSIVNFRKPYSLYSCGMQPLRYSEKMAESQEVGWHRVGKDISYFKNNLINGDGATMYSLTFSFEFPYDYDRVFFAFCFPYTYTDLMEYLSKIENEPTKRTLCKQRLLCRTLAGNLVPLLTVTSRASDIGPVKKKVVIISARVHPGESNSSWIMKGLLDFILADSSKAELLRKQLIFKIVPMLNPDGVVVGNYRCSLTGRDLNRQYQSSLKEAFPTAWYLKNLLTRMQRDHDILLFCDIHGHSRKYNSFIYGCDSKKETTDQQHVFPFLMQKWASDLFSLSCCWYKVQRIKEGTARIAMWRLGVTNSYTLEASMAGSSKGNLAGYHFTTSDYEAIGHHFCEALLEYCTIDDVKDLKAGVICEKLQNADSSDCEESDSSEEEDLCLKVKKITLKGRGLGGKPKNEKGMNS